MSISNNSLNQLGILINLAKTQKSLSNNSLHQLCIFPNCLPNLLARGYFCTAYHARIARAPLAARHATHRCAPLFGARRAARCCAPLAGAHRAAAWGRAGARRYTWRAVPPPKSPS